MTQEVECFWLAPAGQTKVSLRRYSRNRGCPAGSAFCNASVFLLNIPEDEDQDSGDLWPHDDARWPNRCASCGMQFREHDHYQLNHTRLYEREDTGQLMTLAEAPPGALWDATWYDGARPPGPDGIYLMARLPDGGDWFIDGPASGQPFASRSWTREGSLPCITVRPSVKSSKWHGWLIDGVFKESKG